MLLQWGFVWAEPEAKDDDEMIWGVEVCDDGGGSTFSGYHWSHEFIRWSKSVSAIAIFNPNSRENVYPQ